MSEWLVLTGHVSQQILALVSSKKNRIEVANKGLEIVKWGQKGISPELTWDGA